MSTSRIAIRQIAGSLRFDSSGSNNKLMSQTKRCLFGEPTEQDRLQVRADLQKQWEQIHKFDSLKWNFDFEKGIPLEGRYEWKPVHPVTESHTSQDPTSPDKVNNKIQKHILDFFNTKKNQKGSPHRSKSSKRLQAKPASSTHKKPTDKHS